MRNRLIVFLAVFQTVLLLVHGFLFFTWIYFWAPRIAGGTDYGDVGVLDHPGLLAGMAILSVSFLVTSLIGFRLTNIVLRFFYRITAVWLGFVNYAFFSAVACWVSYPCAAADQWRGAGAPLFRAGFSGIGRGGDRVWRDQCGRDARETHHREVCRICPHRGAGAPRC